MLFVPFVLPEVFSTHAEELRPEGCGREGAYNRPKNKLEAVMEATDVGQSLPKSVPQSTLLLLAPIEVKDVHVLKVACANLNG
mmetsp:Transcript_29616/g.39388  ORF Transcript_29616/g.39388 Transcript_29616/m.39388 type:complete len:83 (+) Transcript_29616:776-1024(+)